MAQEKTASLESAVRRHVYSVFLDQCRAPLAREIARALKAPLSDIRRAMRALAVRHELVLQSRGEILMAMPFSAVPTPFHVRSGNRVWFANCVWDALGVPAMIKRDATIVSTCGDCGERMDITVRRGLVKGRGLIHFALPVQEWWRDVVFT